MNLRDMTPAQFSAWEDANTRLDDSHLLDEDGFDAEYVAEATPNTWFEAIPECSERDCDKPVDLALFAALNADQVRLFCDACGDAVLLMTLAINFPSQWAVPALFQVQNLVRKSVSYEQTVSYLQRDYEAFCERQREDFLEAAR